MLTRYSIVVALAFISLAVFPSFALGQTYGIELHNSVQPASGGMGGASFSQPQDLQSAISGNPATIAQFGGTQFGFGGAFVEPTVNVTQTSGLPLVGVDPFSAKSDTPPSLLANIGVIHEVNLMGRRVHLGVAFISNAGLGIDFRHTPEAAGTHVSYLALDNVFSFATELTPNLSVGAALTAGTSILDGPFVDTSSSQSDYGLRYTLGANYDLQNGNSVGVFWQSKKDLKFDNVVRFAGGDFQDLQFDHPENIGFGFAKRNLMQGRLLLAADVIYKNHSSADTLRAIYDDQWVFQLGSQLRMSQRIALRAGYAYNEDPTLDTVPGVVGGVIPVGGIPAVQYLQGQFAAVSQHRITGGVGIRDVVPGMDMDVHVGGLLEGEKTFGATTTQIKGYWVGFGFTWKCGARDACTTAMSDASTVNDCGCENAVF